MEKPIIGITMGDPAGIGPELCLALLASEAVHAVGIPVVFGSYSVLHHVAGVTGMPLPPPSLVRDDGQLDGAQVRPGTIQPQCGAAAARWLHAAVQAALAGEVGAIVTAPLHKEALHAAGFDYPGHTEMLADWTNSTDVCMLMAADEMHVGLVTTHVGIQGVCAGITQTRVSRVIALVHAALRRRSCAQPRITVCGLNPHAGEGGLFGDEEQTILAPAVAEALAQGIRVTGPVPADTAFLPSMRAITDGYVAMYHDQGLIPFKMLAFETGVNVTLGLPIIRTSPDHGTAFDIAWQGKANPTSMLCAWRMAARFCEYSRS